MPNKKIDLPEQTEREALIKALREQVETAERRGHYDTAHHQMLQALLNEENINGKHDQ